MERLERVRAASREYPKSSIRIAIGIFRDSASAGFSFGKPDNKKMTSQTTKITGKA
jgi:hypothetical protein